MICTPQQTLCIMQVIKSSEMEGGGHVMYREQQRCIQGFGGGT